MEELIFQKVQKGDMIFTLEKDRRSGYPIFDQARVLKVGKSKPMASNGKEGFVNSIELVIQDSISQITIYLPTNVNEGIYNGTYYTTNLDNIINEVSMQKQNALNILNNKAKFEAVVSECDNILGLINNRFLGLINNRSESPRNPAPDFEEFKLSMNERLTNQETLLLRIAQELGLDKPKQ